MFHQAMHHKNCLYVIAEQNLHINLLALTHTTSKQSEKKRVKDEHLIRKRKEKRDASSGDAVASPFQLNYNDTNVVCAPSSHC